MDGALDPEKEKANRDTDRWFTVLKSLTDFDEMEVRNVIAGILSPSLPEECMLFFYYRTVGNVRSLLELKNSGHYQAIAMLARSIFELAVDIGVFETIQDAPIKMRAFLDIEKLRASKSVTRFASTHPLTLLSSARIHQDFLANNETRIEDLAMKVWPGKKLSEIKHWSGMRLPERVKLLHVEMLELYECFYRQLSWSVHSGLEGSYGIKSVTFAYMCGTAFNLAARNYQRVLNSVVVYFQLNKFDPLILNRITFAKLLPHVSDAKQGDNLRHELGL